MLERRGRSARPLSLALLGLLAGAGAALSVAHPAQAHPAEGAARDVAAAVADPVRADVDDFVFDSFHADMSLRRGADGHAELAVTETIVARFPDEDQNRGIVRAIPDDDQRVPFHTEVRSVTDEDGAAIPFEITRDGDVVEVSTGDDGYVRGVQTYVISYTQRDVVRAFADTGADELYRDVNGTGWEQPFGTVSAVIEIAPELTAALTGDAACYEGAQGSGTRCRIVGETTDPAQPTLWRAEAESLEPGENVTVAIGFAPGTFTPGEPQYTAMERFAQGAAPLFSAGSLAAALAGVGAVVVAALLGRRQRDAAGRGIVVAQYDPPRGLSVMQAAHLVGRAATAVPAAIVDLAVAGHLRIVDAGPGSAPGAVSLRFVSSCPDDPARQRVLDAVFGAAPAAEAPAAEAVVALQGDTRALAKRLAAVSGQESERLRAAGWTQPRRHTPLFLLFGVVMLAFAVAVVSTVLAAVGGSVGAIGVVAIGVCVLAGVGVFAVWRFRDRVTETGADLRDHLVGLREYLALAETDRLRMLQSPGGAERRTLDGEAVLHLYERLLPYAIIWGVERDWSEALETAAARTGTDPGWYEAAAGFSAARLTAVLASASSATGPAAAWTASTGSSGFGGSMGGGFSGGGSGGGGGGGR